MLQHVLRLPRMLVWWTAFCAAKLFVGLRFLLLSAAGGLSTPPGPGQAHCLRLLFRKGHLLVHRQQAAKMLTFKPGSCATAFRTTRPARVTPHAVVVPTSNNLLSGVCVGQRADEAGVSVSSVEAGMKWTMMRHRDRVKHLGRPADQRKALIRSLVTEVLRHGQIRTTKVKAKVIRSYVDKMITLAKDGSLHARRQAIAFVYDKQVVRNLFAAVTDRYGDREGGYCRIKTEPYLRRGDATEMATIELV